MTTMYEIRTANAAAGMHWFEPESMRFFRSRVGDTVYEGPGGIYFVSSEQFVSPHSGAAPRRYSVRQFNPTTGGIATVGEFNVMSRSQAVARAKYCAQHGPQVED